MKGIGYWDKTTGDLQEVSITLDFHEIPGVIDIFNKWVEEFIKTGGPQETPPLRLPIMDEVLTLWRQMQIIQAMHTKAKDWDNDAIRIINENLISELRGLIILTDQIKTKLQEPGKTQLEQIEKEYTLKITDYIKSEFLNIKTLLERQLKEALRPLFYEEIKKDTKSIIIIDKNPPKQDLFFHPEEIKRVMVEKTSVLCESKSGVIVKFERLIDIEPTEIDQLKVVKPFCSKNT
jgi:hypothetical protein